jgi:cytoskeletal protein CcmA (bactofilin family)
VSSGVVLISGEVEGDIVARERIVLHKTARVAGNLEAPRLVVEDGAQLDGRVKMGDAVPGAKDSPGEE